MAALRLHKDWSELRLTRNPARSKVNVRILMTSLAEFCVVWARDPLATKVGISVLDH